MSRIKPISSLFSLCIDCITTNLKHYPLQYLSYLPKHAKSRIIKKVLARPLYVRGINFNNFLEVITHAHLLSICLLKTDYDDDSLRILSNCTQLQEINLSNTDARVSTHSLQNLFENMKNLVNLEVAQVKQFNDEVLKCVAKNCLKIMKIDMAGCPISDDGFMVLTESIKGLKCVSISKTQVTGQGISKSVKNLAGIQEFRIDNCKEVDSNVLKLIGDHCPLLEIFTFHNCCFEMDVLDTMTTTCKNLKQLYYTVSL